MPHLQPTVRQLQPLGRRDDSAAIVDGQLERAATASLPDLTTSPRPRRRRRRRLTARPRPTT